jgi:energy-coupling factor transporter transmembrane protein EcfT
MTLFALPFIPVWFYHALLGLSLVLFLVAILLGKLPIIRDMLGLLKPISFLLLLGAMFLEGALTDYTIMQDRVAKVQAQADTYQQQSKDLNDKLAKKSKEFKKKNQAKKQVVYKYIQQEVKKYDNECKIPDAFVNAHNQSAEKSK